MIFKHLNPQNQSAENEKSICAKRKINQRRLIFRLAQIDFITSSFFVLSWIFRFLGFGYG
ncbi:MAG TPA: hypothetical protein DCE73_09700 [Paraprevotella xylaniphila]|nr:hypothetical protein [Paraprevotella xylaniphila]